MDTAAISLRDAVICEPLRTAVGGFGGVFRDLPPTELAATVIRYRGRGAYVAVAAALTVDQGGLVSMDLAVAIPINGTAPPPIVVE